MTLLRQSKTLCGALVVLGILIVSTLVPGNSAALGDEEATIDKSALSTSNGKNLIYFINGFDCSSNDYREDQVAPLYIFFDLARSGHWDVIKGNFQKRDCYGSPLVAKASRTLFRRARELKQKGYQRVVFAGHSVGAWSIMIAAQRPDFTADELVLLAPANWGAAKKPNGADNPDFTRNKTEYLDYLHNITKPSVVVLFAKDIFDPGGRGPETEAILSSARVPHLLIDQPQEVWGHGAAWLPAFDYAYGDCIERFLLTPVNGNCRPRELSTTTFGRSVLIASFPTPIRKSSPMRTSLLAREDVCDLFQHRKRGGRHVYVANRIASGILQGVQPHPITFADSGYCDAEGKDKACRWLRRWSNDRLLTFDPMTGLTVGWSTLKAGPAN